MVVASTVRAVVVVDCQDVPPRARHGLEDKGVRSSRAEVEDAVRVDREVADRV